MKRLCIVVLLLIFAFNGNVKAQDLKSIRNESIKYQRLMSMLDVMYVDSVNLHQLTEKAIVGVLSNLDPHSVYISKEEVDDMNEPLEGGFYGIGIQFSIIRDTLVVMDVVSGGPSQKLGMLPHDRIIEIDGENVAGINMSNKGVRSRLKGEKNTIVNLIILRNGEKIPFKIKRDKIPLTSIDAAYMIDDKIGYINISRFAATTIEEFETSIRELINLGMKDLIIDLQSNGGGFMKAAIGIADHLMNGEKLVVYTKGRADGRQDFFEKYNGLFETGRVAILIDSHSASASEILSGAIQDWDRGVIVGRRSFGKGLVQRQYPLTDGSMVRITTAHYYTPSGRCIQKAYTKGDDLDYELEVYKRNSELVNADSIHVIDSLKYKTLVLGRTVYGGGGIIPDVFVPIDTNINYRYSNFLSAKNIIGDFVTSYVDKNRSDLIKKYKTFENFNKNYTVSSSMIEQLIGNGKKAGINAERKFIDPVLPTIKLTIKSVVARSLWGTDKFFIVNNRDNKALKAAVKALKDGEYEKILELNQSINKYIKKNK